MTDLLEKTLYIGLGLFSMTKERAEEIINELVETGKGACRKGQGIER